MVGDFFQYYFESESEESEEDFDDDGITEIS